MDRVLRGRRSARWQQAVWLAAALLLVWRPAAATDRTCGSVAEMIVPSDPNRSASAKLEYFRSLAHCEAGKYGLPPDLALAVMEVESGFNPDADGGDGEVGLMQIMPPTAKMMGFWGSKEELRLPPINIRLGVRYLAEAHELAKRDTCTTVMKYRAGHKESRFSVRSVDYCQRIRKIFAREGIAFSGSIPEPEFGFGVASPASTAATRGGGGGGVCIRRILVPGPRYMSCAAYQERGVANSVFTRRSSIFR